MGSYTCRDLFFFHQAGDQGASTPKQPKTSGGERDPSKDMCFKKPKAWSAQETKTAAGAATGAAVDVNDSVGGSKTDMWRTLDETSNEKDMAYVQQHLLANDTSVSEGKVLYPVFKIGSQKLIRVEYTFKNGQIHILFEKSFPAGSGQQPVVLRLSLMQWHALQTKDILIRETINAVEGKANRTVEEIWKLTDEKQREGKDFQKLPHNWHQFRFLLEGDVVITLKWNYVTKNSTVDIRRCDAVERPGQSVFWKGTREGICLAAKSYDFFSRYLIPKIRNATRMWSDTYKSTEHLWESLFSTYKRRPQGEFPYRPYSFLSFRPVEDSDEEEGEIGCADNACDDDDDDAACRAIDEMYSQYMSDNAEF